MYAEKFLGWTAFSADIRILQTYADNFIVGFQTSVQV